MKSLNGNRSQNYGAINAFFEPAKTGKTHLPLVELVRKEYARVRKPTRSKASDLRIFQEFLRFSHSSNARRQVKRTNETMVGCAREIIGCDKEIVNYERRRGALFDKSILNSQPTAQSNGGV